MPEIVNRLLIIALLLAAPVGVAQAANDITASHTIAAFHIDESAESVGNVTVLEGDILSGPKMLQRGIGVKSGISVWKNGIVPYHIDADLQPFVKVVVKTAVNTWNSVSGVSLVEINPDDKNSPTDYLHFTPANGCASWIGRQGGAQAIWTAPSCSSGSMMHEIGHALGLEHEHTRPDRDQHITINWENVDPKKVGNFDISDENKKFYGPYDYASIMHYGEYFFSSTGGETIKMLNTKDVTIGQRIAPSAGDIKAVSMLYAADVSLVSKAVVASDQTEVTLMVTNEYQQGANSLVIDLDIGKAKLLSNSNSEWQCAADNGTLVCNKDRLLGASQSTVILLLDQEKSVVELDPRLASKSHDVNPNNNNGVIALGDIALGDANGKSLDGTMPQEDQQLQASAGSAGGWIFGVLFILSFVRRRL